MLFLFQLNHLKADDCFLLVTILFFYVLLCSCMLSIKLLSNIVKVKLNHVLILPERGPNLSGECIGITPLENF